MTDHTYTYNPARPYCARCYGTGSVRHTDDTFTPCNCRPKEAPVNHADYELRRVRAQRDELLADHGYMKKYRQAWMDASSLNADLIAACEAVLTWARTPGNHGGNPYAHEFVKLADAAIAKATGADNA